MPLLGSTFTDDTGGLTGYDVAAIGDVNGDGIMDFAITSPQTNYSYGYYSSGPAGKVYVVFGDETGLPLTMDLDDLDGSDGFVIEASDQTSTSLFGFSVQGCGDVNGDGIDDLMISAPGAASQGTYTTKTYSFYSSYVVTYGGYSTYIPPFGYSTYIYTGGGYLTYTTYGYSTYIPPFGYSTYIYTGGGYSTYISPTGYTNFFTNTYTNTYTYSVPYVGEGYVIFGSEDQDAVVDVSTLGSDGIVITGPFGNSFTGLGLSVVGDFNGDGIDDFALSTRLPNIYGGSYSSTPAVAIIFGDDSGGLPETIDFSDPASIGANGILLTDFSDGGLFGPRLGGFGSAMHGCGDFNGDGFGDMIVGHAYAAQSYSYTVQRYSYSYSSYYVPPSGYSTYIVTYGGYSTYISSGYSTYIPPFGYSTYIYTGGGYLTYTTYGYSTYIPPFGYSTYIYTGGGYSTYISSGYSIYIPPSGYSTYIYTSGGYTNFYTNIIGTYTNTYTGVASKGAAYIFFGDDSLPVGSIDVGDLDGTNGFAFVGEDNGDRVGWDVTSIGDINGDGFDDYLIGATGVDVQYTYTNTFYSGYSTYIYSGYTTYIPPSGYSTYIYTGGGYSTYVPSGYTTYYGSYIPTGYYTYIPPFGYSTYVVTYGGYSTYIPTGYWTYIQNTYTNTYTGTLWDAGTGFVLFGSDTGPGVAELSADDLTPALGFAIVGDTINGQLGLSVGGGGDVNGDGFDDMLITAGSQATVSGYYSSYGYGYGYAGTVVAKAYLIFGEDTSVAPASPSLADGLNVADLDGSNGYTFVFSEDFANSGYLPMMQISATIADVNDDGYGDIIFGVTTSTFTPGIGAVTDGYSLVVSGGPDILEFVDGLDGATDGVIDATYFTLPYVYGTNNADMLYADGLNAMIWGRDGNDNIDAGSGKDTAYGGSGKDTILGGGGKDELFGEGGSDALFGEGGNDILDGGFGNDLLDGGGGSDTLFGDKGDDTIDGGSGADVMSGGKGDDIFFVDDVSDVVLENAGEGTDTINASVNFYLGDDIENLVLTGNGDISASGNALDNTLTGNDGMNTLFGGDGDDLLTGGGGADLLEGGIGKDQMIGGSGADLMIGGTGADVMDGESGSDQMFGDGGADSMNGGGGRDVMFGGGGSDTMQGGTSNDVLIGGGGKDYMSGGGGRDTFVFTNLNESGTVSAERDRILDFAQGKDTVDLSALDAISGGADDAFSFIDTAAFSNTAGELRYKVNGAGNTLVLADVDGDGVEDFAIQLDGIYALTAGDFIL